MAKQEQKIDRAMHEGELVTVVKRGTRWGTSTIRTAFGYVKDVPTAELDKLDEGDERADYVVKSD